VKVAVAGLLKGQHGQVGVRSYPNLDIRFANKEDKTGSANDDLFKSADRIVLMGKFISHSLSGRVDRTKSILLHGGMGKLRSTLSHLNAAAPVVREARLEDSHQYGVRNEMPKDQKQTEFKAKFDAAKPGDVLEFKRPPTTSLVAWGKRGEAIRSYYKLNKGIHSDMEMREGVLRFLITKITPPLKGLGREEIKRLSNMTAEEAAAELEAFKNKKNAPVEIAADAPPADVLHDNESPAAKYFPPAAAPATYQGAMSDRAFWQDVYMQSMKTAPGAGAEYHVSQANLAVNSMRALLGG
jgi:hypothetical protein